MLSKEIIAVCSENHKYHTNELCEQNMETLTVKVNGVQSNH
jgi:hypothetical protein